MLEAPCFSRVYPTPILSALVHLLHLPISHQCHSQPHIQNHTAIVTSSDVPSTCFIFVIAPVSCAWKDRTTLKADERMRTVPS